MKGQGWEKVSRKKQLYITLKKQSRQRKSGDEPLGFKTQKPEKAKKRSKTQSMKHGGKVRSYNFIN